MDIGADNVFTYPGWDYSYSIIREKDYIYGIWQYKLQSTYEKPFQCKNRLWENSRSNIGSVLKQG